LGRFNDYERNFVNLYEKSVYEIFLTSAII